MRWVGVFVMLALLGACVQSRVHEVRAAHFSIPAAVSSSSRCGHYTPPPAGATVDERDMLETIRLIDVSYGNGLRETWDKRTAAANCFSAMGYNVLYYHPTYSAIFRDPNVFILGRSGSSEIIFLFTGTEYNDNWFDVVQDFRTRTTGDTPAAGRFYIPTGHAGYRDGVANLIRDQFLPLPRDANGDPSTRDEDGLRWSDLTTNCDPGQRYGGSVLVRFICDNQIASPNDRDQKIDVILTGHSLGAGQAQLAMPMLDGLVWAGNADNGFSVQPNEFWPFRVRHLYAFAPMLAVYARDHDTCAPLNSDRRPRGLNHVNPFEVIERHGLNTRASMIIREGDMVPVFWSPLASDPHCVPGQHFGTYYRINHEGTRMDRVDLDHWALDRPHTSEHYMAPVEDYVRRQVARRARRSN